MAKTLARVHTHTHTHTGSFKENKYNKKRQKYYACILRYKLILLSI